MIKRTELYYFLALLLVAITAFWQVSLFQYTLKYDMIDCFFPWRFIVAEHLQNGMLPLWNPYQSLGYPLFADISNGATWYLPVWILGSLFGYNIYILSFEFFFHIFMAGVGMFYLGKSLKLSLNTAFIIGTAYMLSGFFIGNAQHFTLIVGASWLPFVFAGYFDIIYKGSFKSVVKTAFFLFLFITGGYPTYNITTAYILVLLFCAYSVFLVIKKEKLALKSFLLNNFYLLIITTLICCVVFLSYLDIASGLTRTEGVKLSAAMINPFSPQCMLSFLLPYSVIKDMAFFNTDLSVSNAYIGIITFIFLLYGFFIKKSKTYYFFLLLAITSLLVAMGDYLPIRKFLYNYVPVMNMFRFPGFLRLFSVFGFIVCAGFAIEHFFKNLEKSKKTVFIIGIALLLSFIGIIIYARTQGFLEIKKFVAHDVFTESLNSKLIQHLVFQSFIQIVVLLIFIFSLRFLKNVKHLIFFMCFLIVFEMGLAAQLNAPYTVFYQGIKQVDVMSHHKKNFIKGFPLPGSNIISENTNTKLSYGPFWRNVTIFHKQISQEGFTSLVLRNFSDLCVHYPVLLESVIKNPPLFLTTDFAPFDSLTAQSIIDLKPGKVFFERKIYNKLSPLVHHDKSGYKLEIMEFMPEMIKVKSFSFSSQILILMQNNYKGWSASVNEKEQEIYTADKTLIALYLPKGENTIVFTFEKPLIVFGFYITVISLISLLFLIIFQLIGQGTASRQMP